MILPVVAKSTIIKKVASICMFAIILLSFTNPITLGFTNKNVASTRLTATTSSFSSIAGRGVSISSCLLSYGKESSTSPTGTSSSLTKRTLGNNVYNRRDLIRRHASIQPPVTESDNGMDYLRKNKPSSLIIKLTTFIAVCGVVFFKASSSSSSNIIPNISTFYKTYPILAGFMTCAVKASVADRMAQWRDICQTKFCWQRNMAMVLYSGTILGIIAEIMYNRIFPVLFDKILPFVFGNVAATTGITKSIQMTMFDTCINAPLVWLPPAYLMQALLMKYPKRDALSKYVYDIRNNGLLTKYWSLWIPASLLNFSIIPSHFRVAFVAGVSFFWMIILSLVANNQQDPESCPVEPNEPVLLNPRALD